MVRSLWFSCELSTLSFRRPCIVRHTIVVRSNRPVEYIVTQLTEFTRIACGFSKKDVCRQGR